MGDDGRGGDRGCLLCGEDCRSDVGGIFAGTNGGGAALVGAALVGGSELLGSGMLRPNDGAEVELIDMCPERVGVGDAARAGVLVLVGVLVRDDAYPPDRRTLGDLPRPVRRPAPPLDILVSGAGVPPAWMYR